MKKSKGLIHFIKNMGEPKTDTESALTMKDLEDMMFLPKEPVIITGIEGKSFIDTLCEDKSDEEE